MTLLKGVLFMSEKGNGGSLNLLELTADSLLAGGIAFAITAVLLLAGACAVSAGAIPQTAELQMVVAACAAGGFVGGVVNRRRWRCRRLLAGTSAGAVFLLILLMVNLTIYDGALTGEGDAAAVVCGCLFGSAASGFLPEGKKKRRRKR